MSAPARPEGHIGVHGTKHPHERAGRPKGEPAARRTKVTP